MFFLYELLIVVAYLLDGYLGFGVSVIIFGIILSNSKNSSQEKMLDMLILSLPLHSISIIGENLTHMISWPILILASITMYNMFLMIKNKIKLDKNMLFVFFVSAILLFISNLRFNKVRAIIEIGQVMLMVLPILTTYICRKQWKEHINKEWFSINIKKISDIVLAVALGVLMQYEIYNLFGVRLGKITIFPNRIIYDLFFNAYSVLSIFLGIGIVVLVQRFEFIRNSESIKKNIIVLLKMFIIMIAMIINSSRTGVLAALITVALILLKVFRKMSRKTKVIALLFSLIVTITFISLMSLSRQDMAHFFSDNQRLETYEQGIKLLLSSIESLFIGNGLDMENYTQIMPHNFILETLVTSGIIITILALSVLTELFVYIRRTSYIYIVIHILISSMFITCFYGNPFTTIIFILAIIETSFEKEGSVHGKTKISNSCSSNI